MHKIPGEPSKRLIDLQRRNPLFTREESSSTIRISDPILFIRYLMISNSINIS